MSLSSLARIRSSTVSATRHRHRRNVSGTARSEFNTSPRTKVRNSTSVSRATPLPDYHYRPSSHQLIHDANNGLIYDAYTGPNIYNSDVTEEGPVRMLMFGKPGAGKGTLSGWMTEKYNIQTISTGDLVRAEISANTPLGQNIASTVENGLFVSDDVIVKLVVQKLNAMGSNQSWILDGFPRTLAQGELLSSHLSKADMGLTHIISLSVPSSVILGRLSNRLIHPPSGRVYNLSFNPPIKPNTDDITGEPLQRRKDDKDATVVERRLKEFDERTKPLLQFYQKQRPGAVWDLKGQNSEVNWSALQGILEGRLDLRVMDRRSVEESMFATATA